MSNHKFQLKSLQVLTLAVLVGNFLVLTPKVEAVCQDVIVECQCVAHNMVCVRQLTDCSKTSEIHNEMPTAGSCQGTSASPSALPVVSPSPSDSNTIVVGVGGGPVASSSPQVIASQSNNQTGELPRTGIPLGAVALLGLAPLGFKLKNFSSGFLSKDASSIWAEKQLKK